MLMRAQLSGLYVTAHSNKIFFKLSFALTKDSPVIAFCQPILTPLLQLSNKTISTFSGYFSKGHVQNDTIV